MKFKKTPRNQRSTYTYTYYDNAGKRQSVTIRPGENGVTEMDIKTLHSLDDSEVYINLKNAKPPMMAWDEEWNATHPHEDRLKNYTLSIDSLKDEEEGISTSDRYLSLAAPDEADEQLQIVREVVTTLSEEQQVLYRLHFIEGYSTSKLAEMYGVSAAAISKRLRHIKEKISEKIKNFYF